MFLMSPPDDLADPEPSLDDRKGTLGNGRRPSAPERADYPKAYETSESRLGVISSIFY